MTEAKTEPDLNPFVEAILGRKAMELVALDVARVTDVADVFMICSGRSSRQVSAIAEHVESELKKAGIRPLSVEGVKDGQWALIDYGHVIIHIFYDPVRRFYDLESLWADAPRIDLSAYPQFQQPAEGSDDSDE